MELFDFYKQIYKIFHKQISPYFEQNSIQISKENQTKFLKTSQPTFDQIQSRFPRKVSPDFQRQVSPNSYQNILQIVLSWFKNFTITKMANSYVQFVIIVIILFGRHAKVVFGCAVDLI